jgi:hypothetical protein
MTNEERLAAIEQHRDAIRKLIEECPHNFSPLTPKQLADKWMSVSADCLACNRDFGWRCQKSPDGVCHYIMENGKIPLIDGRNVDPPEGIDECK